MRLPEVEQRQNDELWHYVAVATNQNVILIKMSYVPNFKVLKWERYEWETLIEISFSKPSVVGS